MIELIAVAAAAIIGAALFSLIFACAVVSGADLQVITSVADNPTRWITWPAITGAVAGAAWAVFRAIRD